MSGSASLWEMRKEAMSRKRRLIFDNDGSDVSVLCLGTADQDLLETRAIPALDAGADTYIYTTGWGFGLGLHDSKVGSVLRAQKGHLATNKAADFIRDGSDCLRLQSEYVKGRGVEFLWGMRMNDTHDAWYDGVFMPDNKFKDANPDLMLGKGDKARRADRS